MPLDEDDCAPLNTGRRRIFWTTQPEVCGDYTLCGANCAIPGLEYDDDQPPVATTDASNRSIKTNDWLRSLILNILNTQARTDVPCSTPAAVAGHWSESYRGDNLYIGSQLWNAAGKAYIRVNDAVKAIRAAVEADMGKLVALKVADSVEVTAEYRGANTVNIGIQAWTSRGMSRVNISGRFVEGTWFSTDRI